MIKIMPPKRVGYNICLDSGKIKGQQLLYTEYKSNQLLYFSTSIQAVFSNNGYEYIMKEVLHKI